MTRWLLIASMCACTTASSRKVGYIVGGGMTGAGTLILATDHGQHEGNMIAGGALLAVGATTLVVALLSEAAFN